MPSISSRIHPKFLFSPTSTLPFPSLPSPPPPPPPPIRRRSLPPLRSSPTETPSPAAVSVGDEEEPQDSGAEEKQKFDWFTQWYPVAPLCDLDKRRPHAKTILGLDVVVWWDREQGRWQVFDDRCPHRLAPLSEGRVDQWGRLQCVYHGWCFDGAGKCKYIPQAPDDGPPVHTTNKACVSVYPSIEQNKLLWFWPSTDPWYKSISMKERPPYIPELDDPTYTNTMGSRDLSYGYEVLIENLLDPAHVPYAHHGIMRIPKRGPNRANPDREGGRPLDIRIEQSNISGFLAKQDIGHTKFIAPCIVCAMPPPLPQKGPASSLSSPVESGNKAPQKQRRFLLIFMCIPVSPGKSRVIFVFPRNFGVWVDRVIPRWIFHIGQNLILDSDLYLLHVEERKIAKIGVSNWQKECYVPTKSDAMVVAFRKWLRMYSNNKIDWGSSFSTELPPTPPREQLLERYWSHVKQCSSCAGALKGLKILQLSLQIVSIAALGVVAAVKPNLMSTISRTGVATAAVICYVASKWLSHFISKNFYYHDYDHAFR